jgi:hypothetical protein
MPDKIQYEKDQRFYRDMLVAAAQYNRAVMIAHQAGLDVKTEVDRARIAPSCRRPIEP